MYSFLSWLVMAAVTVVAVVFSLVNRFSLDLNLWPMPYMVTTPLWLVVLVAGFGGFLVGGAVVWLSGGDTRVQLRVALRRAESLERDLFYEQRKSQKLEQNAVAGVVATTPSSTALPSPAATKSGDA